MRCETRMHSAWREREEGGNCGRSMRWLLLALWDMFVVVVLLLKVIRDSQLTPCGPLD